MTRSEYLDEFERLCKVELELTAKKNHDYADDEDTFANFRQIANLTQGRISVEDGILTRISDKLSRIAQLISKEASVKEESIEDTLNDIAVYAKIWIIYRRSERNLERGIKSALRDLDSKQPIKTSPYFQGDVSKIIQNVPRINCNKPITVGMETLFCMGEIGHEGLCWSKKE